MQKRERGGFGVCFHTRKSPCKLVAIYSKLVYNFRTIFRNLQPTDRDCVPFTVLHSYWVPWTSQYSFKICPVVMTASGQSHQLGSQNVNDFLTGPFLLFLLKPSFNFRLHHVHGLFKWTRSFSQGSRLTHPPFLKIVFKLLEWLNSLSFIRLLRLHRRSDLNVEWLKSIAAMVHRTRRSGVIVSMNTSGSAVKITARNISDVSFGNTLVGGNSNIFWNFHPYLGKWSNLTSIFFKRVETTN